MWLLEGCDHEKMGSTFSWKMYKLQKVISFCGVIHTEVDSTPHSQKN